jgi:YfiH family protein
MSMNIFTFDNFFPSTVTHGFYGRRGGVSTGLYESLNCSYQSHDLAEHIDENRLRVLKNLAGKDIRTLKQIHSDICLPVENSCMTGAEEGDALVTKTAGQAIGCLTADCAPVLFYGEDSRGVPVIGVAHAGWGGVLKGVLESTIKSMIDLGADIKTIRAAIGPCLAQENYEVGTEFLWQFINEDKRAEEFFHPYPNLLPKGRRDVHSNSISLQGDGRGEGKHLFNLPAYVEFRLNRAGVHHIAIANIDTYANEGYYFSYRRSTHRKDIDYGRQISAIMIRTT